MKYCRYCGSQIMSEKDTCCSHCGKHIEEDNNSIHINIENMLILLLARLKINGLHFSYVYS